MSRKGISGHHSAKKQEFYRDIDGFTQVEKNKIVEWWPYAMTYYILNDNPEMSANDAITRSREMMDGHKWQLFCLRFSFIGWYLLSALTFGILLIVVMPYMQAAEAEFYEKLKNDELAAKGITAEATFVEEPVAETTESN